MMYIHNFYHSRCIRPVPYRGVYSRYRIIMNAVININVLEPKGNDIMTYLRDARDAVPKKHQDTPTGTAPLYKSVYSGAISRIELARMALSCSHYMPEYLAHLLEVPIHSVLATKTAFNKVFFVTEFWAQSESATIDKLLDALCQLINEGTRPMLQSILDKTEKYCAENGIQYEWAPPTGVYVNKKTRMESNNNKVASPQSSNDNRPVIDLTQTPQEALQRKTSITTLPTRLVSVTTTTLPDNYKSRRIVKPKSTTKKPKAQKKSAAKKRAPKEEQDDSRTCLICMTATKDVLYLPCRHMQVCGGCDDPDKIKECPMCRNHIDQRIVAFM
jgi:hypothetical protein